MSLLHNSGYAVISENINPNSITGIAENAIVRLALSENSNSLWVYQENEFPGSKWGKLKVAIDDVVSLNTSLNNRLLNTSDTFTGLLNVEGSIDVSTEGIFGKNVTAESFISTGGDYSSGIDNQVGNVGAVIQQNSFLYAEINGNYLRKIIGLNNTVLEIGSPGTSLYTGINILPGSAGNDSVKINGNTVYNQANLVAGLDANNVAYTDDINTFNSIQTFQGDIFLDNGGSSSPIIRYKNTSMEVFNYTTNDNMFYSRDGNGGTDFLFRLDPISHLDSYLSIAGSIINKEKIDNWAFTNVANTFIYNQAISNSAPALALKDSNISGTTTAGIYGALQFANNDGYLAGLLDFDGDNIRLWSRNGDIELRKNTNVTGNLDVTGNISINSALFARSTSDYTILYKAQSNNIGLYIGDTDSNNYYDNGGHFFRSSGGASTYMRINSSGNVGIGTTTPSEKLDVNGNIKASGTGTFDSNITGGSITSKGSNNSVWIYDRINSEDSYRFTSVLNNLTLVSRDNNPFLEKTIFTASHSTGGVIFGGEVSTPNLKIPLNGSHWKLGSSASNDVLRFEYNDSIKAYFDSGGTIYSYNHLQANTDVIAGRNLTVTGVGTIGGHVTANSFRTTTTTDDYSFIYRNGLINAGQYSLYVQNENESVAKFISGSNVAGSGGTTLLDVTLGRVSVGVNLHINKGIGVGTTTYYDNSVNLNNSGSYRIGNGDVLSKSGTRLSIAQGTIVSDFVNGNVDFNSNINITGNINDIYVNNVDFINSSDGDILDWSTVQGVTIINKTNSSGSINYPGVYGNTVTFGNFVGANSSSYGRTFSLFKSSASNGLFYRSYDGTGIPNNWLELADKDWVQDNFSELVGDNVAYTHINNNFSVGQTITGEFQKLYLNGSHVNAKQYSLSNHINGISNTGFSIRNETDLTNPFFIDGSDNSWFINNVNLGGNLTLGSYGTIRDKFGDLLLGTVNGIGLRFDAGTTNNYLVPWNMTTDSSSNGIIDLGLDGGRFKTLYSTGLDVSGSGTFGAPVTINSASSGVLQINNSSNSVAQLSSTNSYLAINSTGYIQLQKTTLFYGGLWYQGDGQNLIRSTENDGSWFDVLNIDRTTNTLKFGSVGAVSTGGDTAFYHSSIEKARITDSSFDISGDLNITSTNASKFQIIGASTTPSEGTYLRHLGREIHLGVWDNASHEAGFVISNPNNNNVDGYISATVADTEHWRTLANGNTGFGTSTPTSKVHISTNGVNGLQLSEDLSSSNTSARLLFTNDTVSEGIAVFNASGYLSYRFGAEPNVTSGNEVYRMYSDGTFQITSTTPLIKLSDSTSSHEHLILSNNSELQIRGNFAVDLQANNVSKLTINDTDVSTFTTRVKGSDAQTSTEFTTLGQVNGLIAATDTLQEISTNGDSTSNSLRIVTNDTTPRFKREISINSGGWSRVGFTLSNTLGLSDDFDIGFFGGSTTTNYSYLGYGGYLGRGIRINEANGFVGVNITGANQPLEALDVEGNIKASGTGNFGGDISLGNTSTSGRINLNSNSNYLYGDVNGVIILNADDNLRFYTSGVEKARINDVGLGIGILSPEAPIHTQGVVDGTYTAAIFANTKTYGVGTGINETVKIALSLKENGTSALGRIMSSFVSGAITETSSAYGFLDTYVRYNGVEQLRFKIDSANNTLYSSTASTSSNILVLRDALGTSKFSVRADGRLDIFGTTNITGTLDVTGSGFFSGNVTSTSFTATDGSDSTSLYYNGVTFNRVTSYLVPSEHGTKNLYIGSYQQGIKDWSNIFVYTNSSNDFKWNDEIVATQDWVNTQVATVDTLQEVTENGNSTNNGIIIENNANGVSTSANSSYTAELILKNLNSTNNNLSAISNYDSNGLVNARIGFKNVNHISRHGQIEFLTYSGVGLYTRYTIDKDGYNTWFKGGAFGGKVDITSTGFQQLDIRNNNTNQATGLALYNDVDDFFKLENISSDYGTNDSTRRIKMYTSINIKSIDIGGTSRDSYAIRIPTTGDITLGRVVNTASNLNVVGNATANSFRTTTTTDDYSFIYRDGTLNANQYSLYVQNSNESVAKFISGSNVVASGGTTLLDITLNKVSVGTDLDVSGTVTGQLFKTGNFLSGQLGLQIESGNSVNTTLRFESDNFRFYSGSTARVPLTMNQDGSVNFYSTGTFGDNIHIDKVYGRLKVGKQGGDGDVHFGSSGIGIPTNGAQEYGFYTAYNAYRDTDGFWKHSRTSTVRANKFSGGHHETGFSWSYSDNVGTGNIVWNELMKLDNGGNLNVIGSGTFNDNIFLSGSARLRSTVLTTGNSQLINATAVSIYVGNPSTALRLESSLTPTVNIAGTQETVATQDWVTSQIQTVDTLQEVTTNGNTTNRGIGITAGGLDVSGGNLTVADSAHIGGEITPSAAKLQVNGFMRTGNIWLHEGGNTPTGSAGYLSNNSNVLKWNTNTVYTESTLTKSVIDTLNVDAETLDGLDSTQFLRSDSLDYITYGGVNLPLNYWNYGTGASDMLLDLTKTLEYEFKTTTGPNESALGSNANFVTDNDHEFVGAKVIESASNLTYYSDFIPVKPGETLYGEMWHKYMSGTGGLVYYGLERYDSNRNAIATNNGCTYFVASGLDSTNTSWEKFSNTLVVPTSHTPYNGSDGGGVYYVRVRLLLNYSSGGALRRYGGFKLLRKRGLQEITDYNNVTTNDITAGGLNVNGNITLNTGGYIYGDTTTPYLRLNNVAGALLGYGSSNISVGGATTIKNVTDVARFRNSRVVISPNTIIGATTMEDNPLEKLHVIGNSYVTGSGIFGGKVSINYTDTHVTGNLTPSNSGLDIYNDNASDVAEKGSTITFSDKYLGVNKTTRAAIKGGTETAGNTADGFLAFYTDSNSANSLIERMRINSDGNVGIGIAPNTFADHKLSVGGNILSTTGNIYLSSDKFLHFDLNTTNDYAIWKSGTALNFKSAGSFDFNKDINLTGNLIVSNPLGDSKISLSRVGIDSLKLELDYSGSAASIKTTGSDPLVLGANGQSQLSFSETSLDSRFNGNVVILNNAFFKVDATSVGGYEISRSGFDTWQLRHLDGGLTFYNETDNVKLVQLIDSTLNVNGVTELVSSSNDILNLRRTNWDSGDKWKFLVSGTPTFEALNFSFWDSSLSTENVIFKLTKDSALFNNRVTIENSSAGDGGWDNSGLLIKNMNATPGEVAVAFQNASTNTNYWIEGLNQSDIMKWAYGTSFTDPNTKMQLTNTGQLRLYGDDVDLVFGQITASRSEIYASANLDIRSGSSANILFKPNGTNSLQLHLNGNATFYHNIDITKDLTMVNGISTFQNSGVHETLADVHNNSPVKIGSSTNPNVGLKMGVGSGYVPYIQGSSTTTGLQALKLNPFGGTVETGGDLEVTGKIKGDTSLQVADDTDTASATNVGSLRYKKSGNNTYVDMCMQTGASTYEWVNIVQNNW